MNEKTITIPLVKATYEDIQALNIDLQTQLIVKDNEIERLNNIINKAINYLKSDNYWLSQVKANDELLYILKGSENHE